MGETRGKPKYIYIYIYMSTWSRAGDIFHVRCWSSVLYEQKYLSSPMYPEREDGNFINGLTYVCRQETRVVRVG